MKHLSRLLLILLTLALFWKINLQSYLLGREPMWDFDVYYQTAVDVSRGADPYQVPYMQTAGPPAVIIPYLPLTLVPLAVARSLMIGFTLIAAWASCWLLVKKIHGRPSLSWTLLLQFLFWLTFLPRYNLNVGQPNLIIMWFVTLLLTTSSTKVKGVSLGLITLLKTHYLLAFLSLLRFKLRALFLALGILLALVVMALPVLKPQYYLTYLEHRLGGYISAAAPIADLDYYNQSLRSTLSRLNLGSFYPVLGLGLLISGSLYLLKTGDVASGILVSLLVSPIVWQHYLVVVYPIGLLTLYQFWRRGRVPWYVTFACGLLVLHLPWLHGQPVSLVPGILASHFYVGVLLLWVSRCIITIRGEVA